MPSSAKLSQLDDKVAKARLALEALEQSRKDELKRIEDKQREAEGLVASIIGHAVIAACRANSSLLDSLRPTILESISKKSDANRVTRLFDDIAAG
ncbi:hypothetical protein [Alterisphingorhabdus coralli]|uniref:Uncharacterized protein n=1 Tax=Alterisphingorhabdus coralli TaxID=3071408 RepID=A0AA97I222_9SPHN|nr:hypothetical protein [Parasphingorhabdus sp. SCSIO 66989]WOE76727.1 hypothetical protein RB602_15185 [Parasphingorhabdus sp. SCSIO 66989]